MAKKKPVISCTKKKKRLIKPKFHIDVKFAGEG